MVSPPEEVLRRDMGSASIIVDLVLGHEDRVKLSPTKPWLSQPLFHTNLDGGKVFIEL